MLTRHNIRALAVGTRFVQCCQQESSVRVLSAHKRTINLLSGDELLALALPQAGGSSRFLTLNILPELSGGDEGHLSLTQLKLGHVNIGLQDVSLWYGPLSAQTHVTLTPECLAAFTEALFALGVHPGADAGCPIAPQTVVRWIGLGPGLTPAGDDILLGYLAVYNHLGSDLAWLKAVQDAVEAALQRTTLLSAQLLRNALERDYHEDIQKVLMVLCGLSSEDLLTALRRVAAVGASSGESMIYGMWLALQHIAAASQTSRVASVVPGAKEVTFASQETVPFEEQTQDQKQTVFARQLSVSVAGSCG